MVTTTKNVEELDLFQTLFVSFFFTQHQVPPKIKLYLNFEKLDYKFNFELKNRILNNFIIVMMGF